MGTVLWIALAAWLVLSVLGTIVLAALARGGQREDRRRGFLPDSRRARRH